MRMSVRLLHSSKLVLARLPWCLRAVVAGDVVFVWLIEARTDHPTTKPTISPIADLRHHSTEPRPSPPRKTPDNTSCP